MAAAIGDLAPGGERITKVHLPGRPSLPPLGHSQQARTGLAFSPRGDRLAVAGFDNRVHLYDTVGGTGLATYLNLTVTRGTISGTPAAGSCTGFTADTTAWSGAGAGVIYNGTLASFPASTPGWPHPFPSRTRPLSTQGRW